jgi:NAD(P) transhydrogenase
VDFKEDGAGQGGYAKESSAEFQAAQKATFHKHAKEVDLIVSTAAIPGRKSPVLIEDYMVKDMKPGSVIVDLAAAGGGNCSLTKPGEVYTTDNGVTIVGLMDLPGRMASQASSMYATNMLNLISHVHAKEGASAFWANWNEAFKKGDNGDIIVRSILCCEKGAAVVMPPPPQPTPVKKKEEVKVKEVVPVDPEAIARNQALGVSAVCASVLAGSGDPTFMQLFQTFSLAGATGYQAVWGVAHALHTPLMSVTNAISGLTAVGGMLIIGQGGGFLGQAMAYSSVGISSVNIVGGFAVTKRMLDLFRKPGEQDYSMYMGLPAGILALSPFGLPSCVFSTNTISSLLCIGAIGGLSSQKTAQFGLGVGVAGVAGAMSSALSTVPLVCVPGTLAMIGAGGAGGYAIGTSVEPMRLPQTIAAFHSLVGAAATLTSIGSFLAHPDSGAGHRLAAILGDSIGAITLTGSLIAFLKLDGKMSSKEMNLPGKNMINAGMLTTQLAMAGAFLGADAATGASLLYGTAALSSVMGVHLVSSVGGGDMPVCITVLNSYSGWALVAEGFLLQSPALTVVGSLIGFSGAILTKIMCDGMNRDIMNVIFGGYATVAKSEKGDLGPREHVETNADALAALLGESKQVVVVPGYGMAVARAQYAIGDIAKALMEQGINVKFGIHPVAGRMPGQMNVLLAEAGVPYEWVLEMEEVNPDMDNTDVCLVVGANDITNCAAQDDPESPIAGMPVIEVWKAKTCVFMKRSMAAGYADIDNPVFFKENTQMLLGDAKKMLDEVGPKLKEQFK